MNIALTRSDAGYSIQFRGSRAKAPARDVGELASKILIVTLFSFMSTRIAQDAAATGHVTGMLLLASEALVVALTLVRRSAGAVDRTMKARILTLVATFGPPLVSPDSIDGVVPEPIGGAHRNWEQTATNLRAALRDQLWQLRSRSGERLVQERYEKFRKIGVFEEAV